MNTKLIPSIVSDYISPLDGIVSCDSVPREFDYTLITAYLPKGIRTVCADEEKIAMLKFSNFNLGNRKVYNIVAPHK